MALLDLQAMSAPTEANHGGEGSDVSLLLCASEASVLICL
jgi:hypothetical protein